MFVPLCEKQWIFTLHTCVRFISHTPLFVSPDCHHLLRDAFFSLFKSKVGKILTKDTVLRINLNIDGDPIVSHTHTHSSHSLVNLDSYPLPSGILRYPIPPFHLVCVRLSPPLTLAFSLSLHRHPYLCFPFRSRFIQYNIPIFTSKVVQTSQRMEEKTTTRFLHPLITTLVQYLNERGKKGQKHTRTQ